MGAIPLLETRALSVHFGDRSALEDINLQIYQAEIDGLVGPNGAGKSTLLRTLVGVLPPSHGEVLYKGAVLTGPNPELIYVPQRTAVDWSFPLSVLDVVLMARRTMRTRLLPYGEEDRAAAHDALKQVLMERYAGVQIGALSGGQQQRVILARALLQHGEVYLLDEPFTGVDIPTQELVVSLLHGLREAGKTIIYATHDLEQAGRTADRIFLVNRKLVAAGAPGEVLTGERLREAFGGSAVIPVHHEAGGAR